MPRQATKTIRTLLGGCRWRWHRRIASLLFAGALLSVISSWIAQWHGFVTSRQVRWVQGPRPGFITSIGPAGGLYDSGDGVGLYDESMSPLSAVYPAPQHTVGHPAEILWTLHSIDWNGSIEWSARRNRWDAQAPLEGYNSASETLHLKPSRGHSFYDRNSFYAFHASTQPPAWLTQAHKLTPRRAEHARIRNGDATSARPFLDETRGWVAASAFLPVPGHSDVDSAIPVERWSAQRAGWPMHAMMTEQYAIGPRPPIERVQDMPLISLRHGLRGGLILHHLPQHPLLHPLGHHSLPLVPVWPGFAVNAAFYAACVATLWLAAATTHHILGTKRRRRKRGQCEACGYDLTGLEQCPECGSPAAPRIKPCD